MGYILYSPPHEFVRPAFRRENEIIPEKVFQIEARAIYKHKKFYRFYRRGFPSYDDDLKLMVFRSLKQAKEEQRNLEEYCGEIFEIREYKDKRVGDRID